MYRNKLSDLPVPQDCSSSTCTDQFCEVITTPTNIKNTVIKPVNLLTPVNLLSPSPNKMKSNKFQGRVRGALIKLCRKEKDPGNKSKIRQAAKSLSTDQFHQEIVESEELNDKGTPTKGSSQDAALTVLDLCQELILPPSATL